MNLDYIKKYLKLNEIPHNQTPEFINQVNQYYKHIDENTKELIAKEKAKQTGDKIAESLLNDIFDRNKALEPYRSNFSATLILTDKELTQNSRIGNYSVITLDLITCGLIHDLNRIFTSTIITQKFTPEISRYVRETLDYFANNLFFSRGGNGRHIEIPVLPAYGDKIALNSSSVMTSFQEIFLLSHELGHYFIDKNLLSLFKENTYENAHVLFELILISEKKFKSINDEQKKSLFDEVLADEIAYQIFHETIKDADKPAYDAFFYYLNILLSSQYYVKYLINQKRHNSYEIDSWEVRLKYYNYKFRELDIWGARLNDHILQYVKIIQNETFKLLSLYSNHTKIEKKITKKQAQNFKKKVVKPIVTNE